MFEAMPRRRSSRVVEKEVRAIEDGGGGSASASLAGVAEEDLEGVAAAMGLFD